MKMYIVQKYTEKWKIKTHMTNVVVYQLIFTNDVKKTVDD